MKYIIANWKTNMTLDDVVSWISGFDPSFIPPKIQVVIAPSLIHIFPVADALKKTSVLIASQDVSIEDKGNHTGETAAFQIKELCKFSIVGHSERKEDTKVVIKKIDICLSNGITPIVCFTEPESLSTYKRPGLIYAWEDPNNISQGGVYREKSQEEIIDGVGKIRMILGENESLLYGGSVNKQNIAGLAAMKELDGVLVGNASLDPKHFTEIIRSYIHM
ncbi:MAG: triosephosphate isomerase [Patescibacteria group bacterium]|nr:MAG: triosephosphate isomerase [Patescibacteria group bacterium]